MSRGPRCLPAVALAVAALGCAESPPAAGPLSSVRRGTKLEVMNQLSAAFARGGHACKVDEEADLICDADRRESPTIVASYHSGPGGIHLTFIAAFPWKRVDPCADLSKAINAFNGRAREYYAVCTKDGLTLVSVLGIPETGIGDHDAQAFLNWWSPTAVQAAMAPPFGAELK